jgi:hypothetical protein
MALLRTRFFNTVILIILTCMALSFMAGILRFRFNHKIPFQSQNNLTEVRVFCFVLTAPKYFDTRARAVNSTWGRRCDGLFFITESSNDSQGLPIAPIANITPGYEHLTQKTVLALQYAYEYHFNNFDWFVKADDDTYIFMENLKAFLRQQNSFEPVSFGWISKVCIFIIQRFYEYNSSGFMICQCFFIRLNIDSVLLMNVARQTCSRRQTFEKRDFRLGVFKLHLKR